MANAIYPKAKKAFQSGSINMLTVNIKALAVDGADYTYSAAHEFLSDVPSGARIKSSGNLASKTLGDDGSFDSADASFSAVTGDVFEIVILYVDTGVAGTSRLIAYYDTGITGIPATPDGGNFNVTVDGAGWYTL